MKRRVCYYVLTIVTIWIMLIPFSIAYAAPASNAKRAANGFYYPFAGMRLTSGFKPNRYISESSNKSAHVACDYTDTTGKWNVMAIYDGTVITVHNTLTNGSGRYVIIRHIKNGVTFYSCYQHLKSISVSKGDVVTGGQTIGIAGQSGTTETQYARHLDIRIYSGVNDAWPPRLTEYEKNVVYDGPIVYDGTTYYNPVCIFSGKYDIGVSIDKVDEIPRIAVSTATTTNECRLQSAPYDQTQYHLRDLERGAIVYIAGKVKNSHGNTWYEIVDAKGNRLGYIWEGDLEITESKATATKKADVNLLGVVKTKDGYLKEKPYEAAYHGSTVAKGKTVTIVASYTNSHGNLWYKTSDGYFIYSGDVTTYQMETLFTISAVFRNTERRESHIAPYLDSSDVSVYQSGAEVTVKRFVKNSHGNIWAELSDGSFLCFYDKDTGENKMQFVRMTSDFKVTGTDGYVPTGKRSVSSCALRGKITGDVPMLYVTARVVNRSTGENKISVTANMQMGVKTIDINSTAGTSNKVNINNSMPFKQVDTDGYYCYEVAVQLGFTYNGRTFKFGGEQIAIKSDFWIGNPAEDEETLPDIGGTQIGTGNKVWGDVNDDGSFSLLDILVLIQYNCGENVKINSTNADVSDDGSVDLLDILILIQRNCGISTV